MKRMRKKKMMMMMMMRRKKMEKAMKMTEQRRANQMLLKVEMVGKGNFVPLQVCGKYPVGGIWKIWNPGTGTGTVVIYLDLWSVMSL